jgi:transposase InsO family protein
MKEDLLWLREWEGEAEVRREVGGWVERFNEHHPPSALGDRTPNYAERDHQTSPATLLTAA